MSAARRTLWPVCLATVLVAGAGVPARGERGPPICDPATPPAVVFDGLPARVPYGKHELFSFGRNYDSSARVPGRWVRLEFFNRGHRIGAERTNERGVEWEFWYSLGAADAHVDLTYVERARDGSRCRRRLVKHIELYRDGARFRAFAAPPGYSYARRYVLGEPIRFVLFDRFDYDRRLRLCLRHLASGQGYCVRSRTRSEPRRPSRVVLRGPPRLGWWSAAWSVGSPGEQFFAPHAERLTFHVGLEPLDLQLRDYRFTSDVAGEFGESWQFDWALTVCTTGRGRIRIDADISDDTDYHERRVFRRPQPAGCRRHRLHSENGRFEEGSSYSTLTVRWRGRHKHTRELVGDLPGTD